MEATRAYWVRVALGVFLAVYSVVIAQPLLLIGAIGVGVWLLARQYNYVRAVNRLESELTVNRSLSQSRAVADGSVTVTLAADLESPSLITVEVTNPKPITMEYDSEGRATARIEVGERDATITYTLSCPVAGRHEFKRPQVTIADTDRLFRSEFQVGEPIEFVVEPHAPRNVHVGEGGSEISVMDGIRNVNRRGNEIEPVMIRRYIEGDPAKYIDWNATARFNEPYVRETEDQTEGQSALVIDHRKSMGDGPEGETKLDYLKQIGRAYLSAVHRSGRTTSLYTVGADGIARSERRSEAQNISTYARQKRRLADLTPEGTRRSDPDMSDALTPLEAARTASRLKGPTSKFESTLSTFFNRIDVYAEQMANRALSNTVQTITAEQSGAVDIVIMTDDARRNELQEAVRYATQKNGRVTVFLTPAVLFEPGGLSDLEAAYNRYLEFEEFRRSLARLDGVSAFEVGPRDRLNSVLTSRSSHVSVEA